MTDSNQIAADHYGTIDLAGRVADALRQHGLGEGTLSWERLAAMDQFHVGGAAASEALARRLDLRADMELLDVGCGLGGPSRYLAAVHGCRVTGIDFNAPFVGVADLLNARTGLSERVRCSVADATKTSFADGSFDIAWTQHVAMNIADRNALYGEIFRVLRPEGQFALYDVVAGDGEPLQYPVPWARDASTSFLLSSEETRAALERSGFEIVEWVDFTSVATAAMGGQGQAPSPSANLLVSLVMGDRFGSMTANLRTNFAEGRVKLLQGVVRRPG